MKTVTYNPETHRLVPVEPTVEMKNAAISEGCKRSITEAYSHSDCYRAMLSAAPVFDTVEDNLQPEPVEVEPVLYAEFSEDGGWLGEASEYQDHLEEPIALYTAQPDYEAVKKQRDELVKALEKAREEMSCANFNSAAERIDHALASVKGGAK